MKSPIGSLALALLLHLGLSGILAAQAEPISGRTGEALTQTSDEPAPGSVGLANRAGRRDETVAAGEPATLTVWNRSIVVFRATINQEPLARASRAADRIRALSDRQLREPVLATAARVGERTGFLISVGDAILFGLVPEDVDASSGETLEEVAAEAADNLRAVLAAQVRQRNPAVLLWGAVWSVVATLAYILLMVVVVRLHRIGNRRLESPAGRLEALRIGELKLAQAAVRVIHWTFWALAWVLRLVLAYLWLTFVFARFPLTEPLSDALGHWLYGTVAELLRATLSALPGLATAILILVMARGISGIVGGFLVGVAEGRFQLEWIHPETARATRRIAVLVIWLFGIALAYPFLPGSGSVAFQGISVLLGLMLSLGSAGLLNHIMAGWVITYSRSVRVGDYVSVGDVDGTVAEAGVLALKVVNRRGEEVTVPNAVVTSNILTNYSRRATRGSMVASTCVTIGYDAPWRLVHEMLETAAERTPGILKEPKPRIVQRALSDFYPEYELVVELAAGAPRAETMTALHGQIQDLFNENGVQIMSPHFEGQPDRPVVVPKSAWFTPLAKREAGD